MLPTPFFQLFSFQEDAALRRIIGSDGPKQWNKVALVSTRSAALSRRTVHVPRRK